MIMYTTVRVVVESCVASKSELDGPLTSFTDVTLELTSLNYILQLQ